MTSHIGAEYASGLVHIVGSTAAKVSEVTQVRRLLHGKEDIVFGGHDYIGAGMRYEMKGIDAAVLTVAKP